MAQRVLPVSPYGKPREPEPIDKVRDDIAAKIEARFPGVKISHDLFGWTAARNGEVVCRGQSVPALEALLPFSLGD
jgi:hypothetical protein